MSLVSSQIDIVILQTRALLGSGATRA
jgi:hypothetical protein